MTHSETVEQMKWRFRQYALDKANYHGVNIAEVEEAMDDMGAGPDDLPLGPGVEIKSQVDVNRLPEGTILFRGDPDNPTSFGTFVKRHGILTPVLGATDVAHLPMTIDTYQGSREPVEWLHRGVTKETPAQIRKFMETAIRVCDELRDRHDWCSTYNGIMRGFGMTRQNIMRYGDIDGVSVGDTVSATQAAALPVGTVLKHETPRMRVWFMRVNDSRNRAGTRKIFGRRLEGTVGDLRNLPLPNYSGLMTVEAFPSEHGYGLQLDWANEWNLLPVGTRLSYNETETDDGGNFWMCENHQAHYQEGMTVGVYQPSAFDLNLLVVCSFPVPSA